MTTLMMAQRTQEQLKIIATRGWLCNFTGGHCPRGCAAPCTYQTTCDGVTTSVDFNAPNIEVSLGESQPT